MHAFTCSPLAGTAGRNSVRIALVVASVAAAACGGTSATAPSGSGTAASTASPSSSATATTGSGSAFIVASGTTSVGTVMTDASSGLTLYYFTPEQGSKAVCAADSTCNGTWPPVMASSAPSTLSGFSGQFTLVQISGGGELAYNGWPLHTYAGDSKPGDVNGQGLGGKWFAVTPALTASGAGSSGGGATPAASGTNYGY